MMKECPKCSKSSDSAHWDAETMAEFGTKHITRIDEEGASDAVFVCPKCGEQSEGYEVRNIGEPIGMNVKIRKLHADAVIPQYATVGAAAFDLVAVEDVVIAPGETKKIPLGLAFEIPPGYVMIVAMRSGIALKTKLRQPNGIGVIDSDYRGEVAMMFDNTDQRFDGGTPCYTLINEVTVCADELYPVNTYIIRKGDRVAQAFIQPLPRAEFTVVDELSETERGAGGFGHSGVRTEEAAN